jgi:hypothetical protein
MGKRTLFAVIVFTFFIGLSAAYGADEQGEKMSILQKMNKAYSNFTARQQKSLTAKSEVSKPPLAPKAQSKDKEKTKEEMIADINRNLGSIDEILEVMPALKADKDQAGKIFYTYNGVKIEQLSKDDLQRLHTLVGQLATKLRTERIQRQLETVARVQAINNRATGARAVPVAPPAPPPVRTPAIVARMAPVAPSQLSSQPPVPRVPASAPSASRIPAAPPAPPPTRR